MKESIKDKFGLVWPIHVTNLVRLLVAAREAFDGDMDMFLVLAVVGDRSFSVRRADPDQTYDAWQMEGHPLVAPEDINIRSIADFSGIPRETVRRKLVGLGEKGWVARNKHGMLVATVKARRELEPLTHAGIEYLSELFELFKKLPSR